MNLLKCGTIFSCMKTVRLKNQADGISSHAKLASVIKSWLYSLVLSRLECDILKEFGSLPANSSGKFRSSEVQSVLIVRGPLSQERVGQNKPLKTYVLMNSGPLCEQKVWKSINHIPVDKTEK